MKHCAGKCHQGRKPCRCGDTPHVPILIPLAIGLWALFALLFAVSSF